MKVKEIHLGGVERLKMLEAIIEVAAKATAKQFMDNVKRLTILTGLREQSHGGREAK